MIPPGFGCMASAVHQWGMATHLSGWDSGADGAGCLFFPSSARFSFMQQCWLACRSVRQLSPLIRCLAGGDGAGADAMGVLAGRCPWHKARTGNRCWGVGRQVIAGPVWDMVYRLNPREMESGKESTGWEQGKQHRGEKHKQIRRIACFCFFIIAIMLAAESLLCWHGGLLCKCSSSHKLELNLFPNEPSSFNSSLAVLIC